ncbi:MAG: ABC transporter permease [Gammaproteobacteria bacterium (ex Lamellibrachia satsuma)]|nr:MAG: iron ABC transporter permease [Gammaproteobacteria bacterium (ex Lamellibrachia satsuma)]RRS34395.1 MAG: ABC transporter permease [Gammaproteobacteria bacterium (ex Lamellibrachia satsuma)]RRS36431.1 MAG: ABC transporter permease [Gammaproteobacteria bacterium (ex Lamellibrachia satsuma)]
MLGEIRQSRLLGLLCAIAGSLFLFSLLFGSQAIPAFQALQVTFDDTSNVLALILTEVRLPRALIALFAGATLGLCGAAMQAMLRNPLASPGLIGSASGAALGAVIALYFGSAALSQFSLPIGGILGSLGATLLVYLLAGHNAGTLTLILAGVAINSLTLALISLLLNLAPSPYAVQEIVLWMMGSLSNSSMDNFWIMLPGTLLGWMLLLRVGRALDALTLGEETAQSMGIDLPRLRWRIFLAVALAVGSAVSVTGAIGFIGLVVPHMLRPFVGYQPGRLLAASALGGAILLLAADILVRLLPAQTEIKVGVVTALVGAPFFLYLIIKSRRYSQ